MFINFDVDTGLSINTYRNLGWANGDVLGLVDDILNGHNGNCPLDGARDALEDSSNATPELLEEIHAIVIDI